MYPHLLLPETRSLLDIPLRPFPHPIHHSIDSSPKTSGTCPHLCKPAASIQRGLSNCPCHLSPRAPLSTAFCKSLPLHSALSLHSPTPLLEWSFKSGNVCMPFPLKAFLLVSLSLNYEIPQLGPRNPYNLVFAHLPSLNSCSLLPLTPWASVTFLIPACSFYFFAERPPQSKLRATIILSYTTLCFSFLALTIT